MAGGGQLILQPATPGRHLPPEANSLLASDVDGVVLGLLGIGLGFIGPA